MADNLPPSSADVTESGSLKLPEPCGPQRPVMGLLYFFYWKMGKTYYTLFGNSEPKHNLEDQGLDGISLN
jgi:hypothetical protein